MKKTSLIDVRGRVATFHSRGARLIEQARMLTASSAKSPRKYHVENTPKSPSVLKTGAHPP